MNGSVILNVAERREESKVVAHAPFTDFRFLASLGMTGGKLGIAKDTWEMSNNLASTTGVPSHYQSHY